MVSKVSLDLVCADTGEVFEVERERIDNSGLWVGRKTLRQRQLASFARFCRQYDIREVSPEAARLLGLPDGFSPVPMPEPLDRHWRAAHGAVSFDHQAYCRFVADQEARVGPYKFGSQIIHLEHIPTGRRSTLRRTEYDFLKSIRSTYLDTYSVICDGSVPARVEPSRKKSGEKRRSEHMRGTQFVGRSNSVDRRHSESEDIEPSEVGADFWPVPGSVD